ncbi:MAG: hypothetical protein FWD22_04940 [Treponema sp.]|nr:hypothetical protein [Treponema sp.]
MLLGLLFLAIFCAIIGGIVAGITGIGILFWVISILLFVCGLPFALIGGFISDTVSYVQDREDYRELMRDLAEDERHERYLDLLDSKHTHITYNDNRQVNIHEASDGKQKIK